MTNKNLIAKQELSHPADWKPEAAHADVRAQIEDAIAKRLTEIIATVADFGFESATVNLHDLQDFLRKWNWSLPIPFPQEPCFA